MKVFLFRIGNKYGPEYETYLNKKLKAYNLVWIREPFRSSVALQWNKVFCMAYDTEEPIVVMDIDVILTNDYHKLFEYPVDKDEFLTIRSWWTKKRTPYTINGGFYKYYPQSCRYIYEKFNEDPQYWQKYYIDQGITVGPVNGEQNFIEDSVRERLYLKTFPSEWCTKYTQSEDQNKWLEKKYPGGTLIKDGTFNPQIKLVHFNYSLNKPHESKLFEHLYK